MATREDLVFTLDDLYLREEEAMFTRLTLTKPLDAYSALKDIADLLSFVKDAFEESAAVKNGMDMKMSAPAVAGCTTLLQSIIVGLHEIADMGGCDCHCHEEGT